MIRNAGEGFRRHRPRHGRGRVPAVEVLFNTPAIAALIREDNIKQIPLLIVSGKEEGMQMFNMGLVSQIEQKSIATKEAMYASEWGMRASWAIEGPRRGPRPKER